MRKLWQAIKTWLNPPPAFKDIDAVNASIRPGDIRAVEWFFSRHISWFRAGDMEEACHDSNDTIQLGFGNCMAQAILVRDIIKTWPDWVALIDIIDPPSQFSKTFPHAITRIEGPGVSGYFTNGEFIKR